MKKFTLGLFTLLASAASVYSQPGLLIQAPYSNSSTQLRMPSGTSTQAYMRGCYLVTAAELSALTATNISAIGFALSAGTGGIPVTGNFTLYVQNTSDATFQKSTVYITAINGMTTVYNNTMTVPSTTAAANITLTLSPTFTYTGGGLYIAYDWESTGPFSTLDATYFASNTPGVAMGATEQMGVGGPPPAILTMAEFRPVFRFTAANTATNEAGVTSVIAPGKIAKSLNSPHIIKAVIKNASMNVMNNIPVSLAVTGANTFANTQTVASLAAGVSTTVSFAAFNPVTQGTNAITVSVPSDQNATNNQLSWTQSVTCNVMANNPPTGTYTGAVGFPNSSGVFTSIFNTSVATVLTGVRISISSNAANVGKPVYGIILDDQGAVIATSNTITLTNAMLNTFQQFKFSPGVPLTASTDYYIGMAQPQSGHYPMAYQESTTLLPGQYFGSSLTAFAGFNNSTFGFYGIEPVLGPEVSITKSAETKSVICRGESVTLTADGAATYTWSGGVGAATVSAVNGTNVIVTPTANVTVYTVRATDAAGCTNSVSITQSVSACSGIYANTVKDAKIQLYPNPAVNGKTLITGLEGTNTITVFNMLGQAVLYKTVNEEATAIDLQGQPFGNYLVKITDANNHTKTIKLINRD